MHPLIKYFCTQSDPIENWRESIRRQEVLESPQDIEMWALICATHRHDQVKEEPEPEKAVA